MPAWCEQGCFDGEPLELYERVCEWAHKHGRGRDELDTSADTYLKVKPRLIPDNRLQNRAQLYAVIESTNQLLYRTTAEIPLYDAAACDMSLCLFAEALTLKEMLSDALRTTTNPGEEPSAVNAGHLRTVVTKLEERIKEMEAMNDE